MGPCSIASFSTASPPTRLMAPATPAPIHSSVLAALVIASTSSSVMSPEAISSLVLPTDVFMVLRGASGHGARVAAIIPPRFRRPALSAPVPRSTLEDHENVCRQDQARDRLR